MTSTGTKRKRPHYVGKRQCDDGQQTGQVGEQMLRKDTKLSCSQWKPANTPHENQVSSSVRCPIKFGSCKWSHYVCKAWVTVTNSTEIAQRDGEQLEAAQSITNRAIAPEQQSHSTLLQPVTTEQRREQPRSSEVNESRESRVKHMQTQDEQGKQPRRRSKRINAP